MAEHRPCAPFVSCAAEPCDDDATVEFLHRADNTAVWVPVCDAHAVSAPREGLEYIVEVHGFVPPVITGGHA